jgi:RNA polymerase sigma-70 factor (ECF subfamily)
METDRQGAAPAGVERAGDSVGTAADSLQAQRPRLFALAYRMLGSAGEAEDAVQDAYMRWYARPRDDVANPPAFLTTMVTNQCLDVLKSTRRQREEYPGVWLPEPAALGQVPGPEDDLQRLESLSLAFLSLLETLSPLERAVYLLVDVFDYSHAEVAAIVQRSPEACRQTLRRARDHLAALKRMSAPEERHRELLTSFIVATRSGDTAALERLLAADVESRADGGGHVHAATKPVIGVRAVSRLFAGLSRQLPPELHVRVETLNGWPTALMSVEGVLWSALQIQVSDGLIARIDSVINPHKLARLARAFGLHTNAR